MSACAGGSADAIGDSTRNADAFCAARVLCATSVRDGRGGARPTGRGTARWTPSQRVRCHLRRVQLALQLVLPRVLQLVLVLQWVQLVLLQWLHLPDVVSP
jgi:hypothetical protein